MKEIKLTRGYVALVDDEDYEYLNQFKWQSHKKMNTIYADRSIHCYSTNGKRSSATIRMHREIMRPLEGMYVDHINHDGLDNRKKNLRIVTHRQNMSNLSRGNKTGYMGVFKSKNKYASCINIKGKTHHLGTYKTPLEAHNVYLAAIAHLREKDNIKVKR